MRGVEGCIIRTTQRESSKKVKDNLMNDCAAMMEITGGIRTDRTMISGIHLTYIWCMS